MKKSETVLNRLTGEAADLVEQISDRRTIMKAGAGAVVGASALTTGWQFAAAQESTPAASATPEVCVLTPELTEGPYFLSGDLIRTDITEGRAGVPLHLKIGVLNPNTCSPVENVAVDIWHCDALGFYSGVDGNGSGAGDPTPEDLDTIPEDNFLRGIQITDAEGMVEFDTIYPGWYTGRAIHIHLMVHVGGTVDDGTETYQGGHQAHTGQLFFGEDVNDLVFALEPYALRTSTRLANADDNILGEHEDEPGFLLNLTRIVEGSVEDGYLGTITLGVDPDAVQR